MPPKGNGEVDITALETSLTGTLQFILHKGEATPYPRYGDTVSGVLALVDSVRPALEAGASRASARPTPRGARAGSPPARTRASR